MAHTDKTTPYRVVKARNECRCAGYPCRHRSITASVAPLRRRYLRAERTRVRAVLAHGEQPPGYRHRHRALWGAS